MPPYSESCNKPNREKANGKQRKMLTTRFKCSTVYMAIYLFVSESDFPRTDSSVCHFIGSQLTLKMEGVRSSQISINFYWITWCLTPVENSLNCHHCKNTSLGCGNT
jgi:hypothetical protein